ncbi:MAG TPA: DUF3443 family protein [Steroidobacteraceae bacterium]
MRKFLALIVTPLVILAGCGGGSGTTTTPPPPPPPPPGQTIATPGPPNVESLVVDSGPGALTSPAVNTAFVSVTVCLPGTTTCQTIDHIEVDTGSSGLRIVTGATIVDSNGNPAGTFSLSLPPAPPSTAGNVLAECLQFADGFSWGSVNTADIKLPVSGKTATNVTVQVIGAASAGDPSKANPTCVPPPPLNTNPCMGRENTVPCFGANGILGVGPFVNDCNSFGSCDPQPQVCSSGICYPGNSATYYSCTAAASCAEVAAGTVSAQQQLPNPAVRFAADNNGVIIELPAVGDTGNPAPVKGSLVFGIGTESNNALDSATKLPMCPGTSPAPSGCMLGTAVLAGTITASLNGANYPESYLDSGSNANFFPTTSIPSCQAPNQGFLCPGSTTSENAVLTGTDGTTAAADFSVANADSLFSANGGMNYAFSNLAGSNYSSSLPNYSVDLGLSFFYGHNVFTGFENPGVSTPYFAY